MVESEESTSLTPSIEILSTNKNVATRLQFALSQLVFFPRDNFLNTTPVC